MDRLAAILENGEVKNSVDICTLGWQRDDSTTRTRIIFILPYQKGLLELLKEMKSCEAVPKNVAEIFSVEEDTSERSVKPEHEGEAKKLRVERNRAITQANKLREKFDTDLLALGIVNKEDVSLDFCDKRYEIPEEWYGNASIRLSITVPYLSEIRNKYVATKEY